MSFVVQVTQPPLLFQPHGLDIALLRLTAVEETVAEELLQQAAGLGLVGTGFAELLEGATGCLRIAHDDVFPAFRAQNGVHARAVQLLVGPESVANVLLFHHPDEISLPLVAVVTYLTHVHGQVGLLLVTDVVADGCGCGITAVAVAGVHDFIVERPVGEHEEVGIPTGSTQQDDVVLVGLPDGLRGSLVERLQKQVEGVLIGKIVGNGLVHQLIAQDDGLVPVVTGYALPDVAEQLL